MAEDLSNKASQQANGQAVVLAHKSDRLGGHRRAFVVTALIAALVMVPVWFLYRQHHQYTSSPPGWLHSVASPAFAWNLAPSSSAEPVSERRYLTRDHLFGALHIVYYVPQRCECLRETQALSKLLESLLLRGSRSQGASGSDPKLVVPIRGVLIAEEDRLESLVENLSDGLGGSFEEKQMAEERERPEVNQGARAHEARTWWIRVAHDRYVLSDLDDFWALWREELSGTSSGNLQESGAVQSGGSEHLGVTSEPFVMIWDHGARIRSWVRAGQLYLDHTYAVKIEDHPLRRALSWAVFQGSMSEYLRKRTFFGEKKDSRG